MSLAPFVVGVDAHPNSITIVQLDQHARTRRTQTEANTSAGRQALLMPLTQPKRTVLAIENAKGHALPLTQDALARGYTVVDVPPAHVAGLRSKRNQAKDDARDALHAALAYTHDRDRYEPVQLPSNALELRCLARARETLVQQRVRLEAQLAGYRGSSLTPQAVVEALEVISSNSESKPTNCKTP